jgi:transposase-like protein
MRAESQEPPQPWTASRKRAVVLELLQGKDTVAGTARRLGLPVNTLLTWREQGLREGAAPAQPRRETLLMQGIQPQQSRISGLA